VDRPIAFFVRADGLSIQQRASHEQRRGARLNKENVNLSFMPLGRAVAFPVNQQGTVVGKVCDLLHRKVMGIGGGIVAHLLLELV
jgi:hypothetical protein